jgi:hypothetical protein
VTAGRATGPGEAVGQNDIVAIRTEHPGGGDDRQYEVNYDIRAPTALIIELE